MSSYVVERIAHVYLANIPDVYYSSLPTEVAGVEVMTIYYLQGIFFALCHLMSQKCMDCYNIFIL